MYSMQQKTYDTLKEIQMEENNNLKPGFEQQSSMKIWLDFIKEQSEKNKKAVIRIGITTGIASLLAGGVLTTYSAIISRDIAHFTIGNWLYYSFTKPISWLLGTVIFGLINVGITKFIVGTHKTAIRDKDRNYDGSERGDNGTAMKATKEERRNMFIYGDYPELNDIILGCDTEDKHEMYVLNTGKEKVAEGLNKNVFVVGAPGCGKTFSYIIPAIMQKIRAGESIVVTDLKKDIYGSTAEMAKANGYVVKVLNFDNRFFLHSDSINFMSLVGENVSLITTLAETIISNIYGEEQEDYWKTIETNLLQAIMIYIATNDTGIPKTLASVYKTINEKTSAQISAIAKGLDLDNPAVPFFNNFTTMSAQVQDQCKSGLSSHLQALANPVIQKLVSEDDVDLSLLGKEKCIYYITLNDQNPKPTSWLVAMTFTLMFEQLTQLADSQMNHKLPVPVTLLMDEFYNLGVIPAFDSKISQVRSRDIRCWVVVQSLAQLETLYDKTWEKIVECCTTWIVMKVNAQGTAEYFEKMSGVQTTDTVSDRYVEKKTDAIQYHNEVQRTVARGQRMVYFADEIRRLSPTHVLVWVSGHNVAELEKVGFTEHPMCKEIRECNCVAHIPNWIYTLSDSERERLGVMDETELWEEEGTRKIELCTPEDFKEHWNKEKQKMLDKMLAEADKTA